MQSAEDLANALVAEFSSRNISATLSKTADEYVCEAEINNLPATIYIGTDPDEGDIRWTATDDQMRRIPNRQVSPSDLADEVVDTFINPA